MRITESIEVHENLNQKLFNGDKLRDDVRNAAFDIAMYFIQSLEFQVKVLDIQLLGSNAAYNYTDDSDFDLHIITNFDRYDADQTLIKALFNAERAKWSNNYDITIKGYKVEMYVQDVNESNASNGIYSIKDNEWVKYPKKIELPEYSDFEERLSEWKQKLESAIPSGDAEKIQDAIDELYLMRKKSIDADGEFGEGNLLFKELRNFGLLDELKNALKSSIAQDLTLESLYL